jgi:hypothetical protein
MAAVWAVLAASGKAILALGALHTISLDPFHYIHRSFLYLLKKWLTLWDLNPPK